MEKKKPLTVLTGFSLTDKCHLMKKIQERKAAFEVNAASSHFALQMELFESRNNLKVIGQHGIDTYAYKSCFPIDFSRLEQFFSEFPNEVFRMKGKCYSPSNQELYVISQVGSSIQVDTLALYTNRAHIHELLPPFIIYPCKFHFAWLLFEKDIYPYMVLLLQKLQQKQVGLFFDQLLIRLDRVIKTN